MTPKISGHISDQIFRAIDHKKLTAMEVIDFSKAFHSICHSSLETLRNLGKTSQTLKWFESYLAVRMQSTWVGTSLPDQLSVTYNVL